MTVVLSFFFVILDGKFKFFGFKNFNYGSVFHN